MMEAYARRLVCAHCGREARLSTIPEADTIIALGETYGVLQGVELLALIGVLEHVQRRAGAIIGGDKMRKRIPTQGASAKRGARSVARCS